MSGRLGTLSQSELSKRRKHPASAGVSSLITPSGTRVARSKIRASNSRKGITSSKSLLEDIKK